MQMNPGTFSTINGKLGDTSRSCQICGSRRSSAQMTLQRRVQRAPIEKLRRAVRVRRPRQGGNGVDHLPEFPWLVPQRAGQAHPQQVSVRPSSCQDVGVDPKSLLDLSIGGGEKRDRRALQAERRARPGRRTHDIIKAKVPVLRLGFDSSTPMIRRTIHTRSFSSIA